MTIQEAIEMVRKLQAEGDSLEKQGIAKDWVCVIHPVLHGHLQDLIPQDANILVRTVGIEQFTRRKTYVESRTEVTEVKYMSEEMYQAVFKGVGVDALLEEMMQQYRDKLIFDPHLYGENYTWDYTKGFYKK